MRDLDGAVAVITGGGSGIGRASSLALSSAGVRVVVADLNAERASAVAHEITAKGGTAIALVCDVGSDEQVRALNDAAVASFGQVDVVMNNVSTLPIGFPEQLPMEAWRDAVELNLLSVARSLCVFLPPMVARGRGHVVNTASTAGLFAYSYERLPYSATKGAVVALSEALALYCRPRGVGVTCLCPGPVQTHIGEQMRWFGERPPLHAPALALLTPEVVGAQVLDAIVHDRFFVLTHPEVQDILVARAQDPDGFVAAQTRALAKQDTETGGGPTR